MAFIPQDGAEILLALAGDYVVQLGSDILFGGADDPAEPVPFPQDGAAILFNFSGDYVPLSGDAILFGGGASEVEPPPETGSLLVPSPDFPIPWGEKERLNRLLGAGWNAQRFVTRTFGLPYQKLGAAERPVAAKWRQKEGLDESLRSGWRVLERTPERQTRYPWLSVVAKDRPYRAPWGDCDERSDRAAISRYGHPPPNERHFDLLHGDHPANDIIARIPYINGLPWKDINHRTTWGPKYYAEVCWRHYEPPAGDRLNFNLDLPITHVGDKDNIDFFFDQYTFDRRCVHREPSGWRDNYYYVKPGLIPAGLIKKVYAMLNTASLTRISDTAPIEVSSLTLSTDWDSVYWSIKADVGSDAHLALLEPTPDGPIAVQAAINGYIWKMQVDRTSYGRAFKGSSRGMEGRSISAQLGAPAAEVRTYTETMERTAAQLASQELENTGWSLTFTPTDWPVPANQFSYADLAPMSAIKLVADACGAMIQTHMSAQTITVQPKYKAKPWLWDSTTPDLIIPSAMVDKLNHEWDERPAHNAVFMSGTISAKVYLESTAGDKSASMITDPLITDVYAARQRGIAELARTGKWSKYKMELPVFPAPATPGVILPGTLIQFLDGAISWKGVVAAVSVTAQWGSNGLKVRQTIDVERYRGR